MRELGSNSVNLVLVCGLPGSGKTSLVRGAKLTVPCGDNRVFVYTLEQDEIYERLCKGSHHDTYFDPEGWKNSRVELVRTVGQLLETHSRKSSKENSDLWVEPTACCTSATPSKTVAFIIVDDNLFYRSMRRTLFNLARTHSAGFAQVQVICPVEECIARNASRTKPVPENVIRDMAEKFEVPIPASHEWERHTIEVSSHPHAPTFPWESIIQFCEESIAVLDDTVEKEADRVANLTNVAHQFDLQARKAISEVMKDITSTATPKTLQTLGKDLSALKQRHIASIHKRTGHLDLQDLNELMQAFRHDLQGHVRKIK